MGLSWIFWFTWALVSVPLIPLVAFVEFPPKKAILSTKVTRPPFSMTVWAAESPARPPAANQKKKNGLKKRV